MAGVVVRSDPSRARAVAGWVGQVLAWLVVLGVAGVLALAVLIPRLAGATPYAVLTGSMRPSLPEGTLVVVRPVSPSAIGIGSVITYQLRSGRPTVVTHRVVAVAIDGAGSRTFQTRGDANDVPDEGWVRPVQLKGALWYAVPRLGRVNVVLSGKEHQLLVSVVAVALLAYAAAMFTGSVRDRRATAVQRQGGQP